MPPTSQFGKLPAFLVTLPLLFSSQNAGCTELSTDLPPPAIMQTTGGLVTTTGGMAATGGVQTTGGMAITGGDLSPASGGLANTGGMPLSGGRVVSGGFVPSGGVMTTGGVTESGGTQNSGGMVQTGGTPGTGGSLTAGDTESGVFVGTVVAHNAARAAENASPPIADLTWSNELAAFAQDWADRLASNGCGIKHRPQPESSDQDTFGGEFQSYGENIYAAWSSERPPTTPAAEVVAGWSGEIACYTHGLFYETDDCDMACTAAMSSTGCGHYTQVVWRETKRVGCGRSTCSNSEIWVCNYDPPGNYVGELVF